MAGFYVLETMALHGQCTTSAEFIMHTPEQGEMMWNPLEHAIVKQKQNNDKGHSFS